MKPADDIVVERREKAVAWARESALFRLLVAEGFVKEARVLCRNWAVCNQWDVGLSSGWERLLDEMIDAVKETE